MSTATTVSRTPSAWRLGMVSIWPAVLSCLGGIAAQFVLNALFAIVFHASSDRGPESVSLAAFNAALVVGIVLVVAGVNQTISYMRAGSLSGAPRRTLALASYVTSVVCIALGSIIWWVLILVRPYLFFMPKTVYTPGVDTWLLVVVFWITCDAAGRLGANVFRRRGGGWRVAIASFVGAVTVAVPAAWLPLTLIHKAGVTGPMPPSLWLLGIIPLVVVIANWRLTLTGRIRGLN